MVPPLCRMCRTLPQPPPHGSLLYRSWRSADVWRIGQLLREGQRQCNACKSLRPSSTPYLSSKAGPTARTRGAWCSSRSSGLRQFVAAVAPRPSWDFLLALCLVLNSPGGAASGQRTPGRGPILKSQFQTSLRATRSRNAIAEWSWRVPRPNVASHTCRWDSQLFQVFLQG